MRFPAILKQDKTNVDFRNTACLLELSLLLSLIMRYEIYIGSFRRKCERCRVSWKWHRVVCWRLSWTARSQGRAGGRDSGECTQGLKFCCWHWGERKPLWIRQQNQEPEQSLEFIAWGGSLSLLIIAIIYWAFKYKHCGKLFLGGGVPHSVAQSGLEITL